MADYRTKPRPVRAVAERQLTPESYNQIDDELDQMGVFAKGYWQEVDGELTVTGLRIGTGEDRIVAFYGDWIVRDSAGNLSVRKGGEPA